MNDVQKRELKLFEDPSIPQNPHVAHVAFANNGAKLIVHDGSSQGLYFYHWQSCIKTNEVVALPQQQKSKLFFFAQKLVSLLRNRQRGGNYQHGEYGYLSPFSPSVQSQKSGQ